MSATRKKVFPLSNATPATAAPVLKVSEKSRLMQRHRGLELATHNASRGDRSPIEIGLGVGSALVATSEAGATGHTAGRVILDVELDQLADNPVNPRPGLSRREVNALVDTMREQGQLGSVQAWRASKDSASPFVLKEGHTRREAARILGWKTLRVEVVEPPPDNRQLFQESFALNEKRHKQTAVSNARSFTARIADGTYASQRQLARDVGKDVAEVSRLLAIAKLPEGLLDAANEAPEDLGTMRLHLLANRFEKLSASKGEAAAGEQCMKYLGRIVSEAMTVQQVKRLLGDPDKAQLPLAPRQGAARRVVFKVGAQGRLSEYDDGSMKLELKLDKAKLAELGPRLLDLLEEHGISSGRSDKGSSDPASTGDVARDQDSVDPG